MAAFRVVEGSLNSNIGAFSAIPLSGRAFGKPNIARRRDASSSVSRARSNGGEEMSEQPL